MKKLIVSDYDRTLYVNELDMIKNIDSINKFVKLGNLFVVATGRSFTNFKELINKYNIPLSYVILNHGAVILDKDLNIIQSTTIDKKDLLELVNYIKFNLNIKELVLYGKLENNVAINDDIVKIMIRFDSRSEVVQAYRKMYKLFSNKYNIYLINSKHNRIEFISKNIDKSIAIRKLIDIEELENEYVYTIGDSDNDLNMIKDFNGYGMKHSMKNIINVSNKLYESVSLLVEDIIDSDV